MTIIEGTLKLDVLHSRKCRAGTAIIVWLFLPPKSQSFKKISFSPQGSCGCYYLALCLKTSQPLLGHSFCSQICEVYYRLKSIHLLHCLWASMGNIASPSNISLPFCKDLVRRRHALCRAVVTDGEIHFLQIITLDHTGSQVK